MGKPAKKPPYPTASLPALIPAVIALLEIVWSLLESVAVHVIPLLVHVFVEYDDELAVGIVSKVSFTQLAGGAVNAFVVPETVELFTEAFPAASLAFT